MTAKSHEAEPTRTALFAGSFDPYTIGHASIVGRALPLFDKIIIAVGVNPGKPGRRPAGELVAAIERVYASLPPGRVEVVSYSHELTVDLARRLGARWLLRGVRSVADFEYERNLADLNRKLSGLETILLYTLPEYAAVSSSAVRELESYGADVSQFMPKPLSSH